MNALAICHFPKSCAAADFFKVTVKVVILLPKATIPKVLERKKRTREDSNLKPSDP